MGLLRVSYEQIEAVSFLDFLATPRTIISLAETRDKLSEANISVSEADYLLGLTDLTGELMRYGINSIGTSGVGDSSSIVSVAESCVRDMEAGARPALLWIDSADCCPSDGAIKPRGKRPRQEALRHEAVFEKARRRFVHVVWSASVRMLIQASE